MTTADRHAMPPVVARAWLACQIRLHRAGPVEWSHRKERPVHRHKPTDFWSLNLLQSGRVEVLYAGGGLALRGEAAWLVPPATNWRTRRLARRAEHAQALISILPAEAGPHPLAGVTRVIALPPPAEGVGALFADESGRSAWSASPAARLRMRPAAELLLLDCLARAFADGRLDPPEGRGHRRGPRHLADDLVDLVHRRCTSRDFGLADIVREAGLSTPQVRAIFRQTTGLSPTRYLRQQRLLLARRLLLEGDVDSIKAIARKCGFSTTSLFDRHFRRAFGTTPSRWRDRAREDDR